MIYRPMRPRKLRLLLQAEMIEAAAVGCIEDPAAVREKLLALIDIHAPDKDEYLDLFIHNTVGDINEITACVLAKWLVWDDIKYLFWQGDTSLPARGEAKQELLVYIGTVLKHRQDVRSLDFPV